MKSKGKGEGKEQERLKQRRCSNMQKGKGKRMAGGDKREHMEKHGGR